MSLLLKNKIETDITHPELSLTVPLPDAPHLAESFKASLSNWNLKLFNEKGCLAFLHTLRNKSTRDEMAEMKKLIPKNDYVRTKDRQDPIAVLKLSEDKLVDQLSKVGYIVHTIIPETSKYTEKNKVGMYTNPIGICICPYEYLFMIAYDNVIIESKIFKVQLHNPVEKIEFLKSVKGRQIWYRSGRLFDFEPKVQLFFLSIKSKNVDKMRSKDEVVAYAKSCGLKAKKDRCTLKQLKFHVNQYLERSTRQMGFAVFIFQTMIRLISSLLIVPGER